LKDRSFPFDLCPFLPKKWERLGDIVIVKLNPKVESYGSLIAGTLLHFVPSKIYLESLTMILKGVRLVLLDEEGIKGELREPSVRLLFDNSRGENTLTETTHVENGIKYRLDVSKCMFSSGNGTERIHFANIKAKGEVRDILEF
jgi:tRNA wybutosine-synthesizing protein 2